jgi:hypothetical protein
MRGCRDVGIAIGAYCKRLVHHYGCLFRRLLVDCHQFQSGSLGVEARRGPYNPS